MSRNRRRPHIRLGQETRNYRGIKLRRVIAARTFKGCNGIVIPRGTLGGWAQSTKSIRDNGWVAEDAIVMENAVISNRALARKNARLSGNTILTGDAIATDDAELSGDTLVKGNSVCMEKTRLAGHAVLINTVLAGTSRIGGDVDLYGMRIEGNSQIRGNLVLKAPLTLRDANIYNQVRDTLDAQIKWGTSNVVIDVLAYRNQAGSFWISYAARHLDSEQLLFEGIVASSSELEVRLCEGLQRLSLTDPNLLVAIHVLGRELGLRLLDMMV